MHLADYSLAPLALRAAKQAISRSEDLALETGNMSHPVQDQSLTLTSCLRP